MLYRSGSAHDSNGAEAFILHCIEQVQTAVPGIVIEVRMDSAFFSDTIVGALEKTEIEYTISLQFEHFIQLKSQIDQRCRLFGLDARCDYFETHCKPKSRARRHRFIFVRQQSKIQQKTALQLDPFVPYEYGFIFKVVLTNKQLSAATAVALSQWAW